MLWLRRFGICAKTAIPESPEAMCNWFAETWLWYVTGPLIGLFVPALVLAANKLFGISSNLRHLCAAILLGKVEFFRYDWRRVGLWNLVFLFGVFVAGFFAGGLAATYFILSRLL
jgi:hypothetical protein